MKNLKNYNIKNKKILFRADLNVPLVDGVITDTSRIQAIKSSIEILISNKNKIFLIAHFGRPKGEIVNKYGKEKVLKLAKKKNRDMGGRLNWINGTFTSSVKRSKVKPDKK